MENSIIKDTHLTIFILVEHMMLFLFMFLLSEVVVVVMIVVAVVIFAKETQHAGEVEVTLNMPVLVKWLSVLSN